MLNGTRITATITEITRLDSSTNGNPRFEISFEGLPSRRTGTDSSVSYAVENHRVGDRVVVTLDGRKSIIDIERA